VNRKNSLSKSALLLLLGLLAYSALTPSEFMECQSLFPDENLDIFGVFRPFQKQSPAPRESAIIASPSPPSNSGSLHILFEIFFSQPAKSPIAVTAILRC
jgi:hypothetical protein